MICQFKPPEIYLKTALINPFRYLWKKMIYFKFLEKVIYVYNLFRSNVFFNRHSHFFYIYHLHACKSKICIYCVQEITINWISRLSHYSYQFYFLQKWFYISFIFELLIVIFRCRKNRLRSIISQSKHPEVYYKNGLMESFKYLGNEMFSYKFWEKVIILHPFQTKCVF